MSEEDLSLRWWYEYHREDYDAVRGRLRIARNVMLRGPIDEAVNMLRKASVFSVLSIQTPLDRAERAFVAWDTGTRLDEAAFTTVYGGRKAEWLQHSLANHNFSETVQRWREDGAVSALRHLLDFKGLGERKAAFALALVGATDLMCLDTNVQKFTDMDVPRKFRGDVDAYIETCESVRLAEHSTFESVEPFIFQYAVFDYQRQEHARHMMFYESILPGLLLDA